MGLLLVGRISLYKAQVQVNRGPPHKTIYTESNKGESGEIPPKHGYRGNFPELNTNGLCLNIKKQLMEPHKIAKLL